MENAVLLRVEIDFLRVIALSENIFTLPSLLEIATSPKPRSCTLAINST